MGMMTELRKDQARRFAEKLGVDGDKLYEGAMAAWSNLNPQSVLFEQALSVAGVVLAAAKQSAGHVGGYTDRAGIDNRANSALCSADLIINDVHVPPAVRLVQLAKLLAREPILTDTSPAAYEVRAQAERMPWPRPAEPDSQPSGAEPTVTVTRVGKTPGKYRYQLAFSKLPEQTFGPWSFTETVHDLRLSALLEPLDARNLVLDAAANGTATRATN